MEPSSARPISQARSGEHLVITEPTPKRVRVRFGKQWIADSRGVLLMHETGTTPVYYFPRRDVRMDLLHTSDHRTKCPYKGEASYWDVHVEDRIAAMAVWAYPNPIAGQEALREYVAFYWHKMDQWFEEEEEVYVHPRDPYKRIDVLQTSLPIRVVIGGQIVAESHHPRLLLETGLPPRYYVPPTDVRLDLLAPSDTVTGCPYKGQARYQSAYVDGREIKDIVWRYPYAHLEVSAIQGWMCFFQERVDELWVDGVLQEKPTTLWS